jgi:hypothetical protein
MKKQIQRYKLEKKARSFNYRIVIIIGIIVTILNLNYKILTFTQLKD